MAEPSPVELYWIPLGAGGHCVRLSGRVFEAILAVRERRPRGDLYHAALIVGLDGESYTIELAPAWPRSGSSRGVVSTGPVGARHLGRCRWFRYELRCWHDGSIPDLDWAVGGARRLSDDPSVVRRILDGAPLVPTPVWGRDESGAGEMWSCNSAIAWLLTRAGIAAGALAPPEGGRAPGWAAGVTVANRELARGSVAAASQMREAALPVPRPTDCLRSAPEASIGAPPSSSNRRHG